MEQIERKTTILLTRDLHRRLLKLAGIMGKSMGQLLREAAEQQYFSAPTTEKRRVVQKMAAMKVPVGDPFEIKSEIMNGFSKRLQ